MPSATYSTSLSIGGVTLSPPPVSRTFDHPNPFEVTLPAGKVVTSWVKTDADTAACNLPGSHGYATGTFDVYWTESGVAKRRYNVPGTVTVNALALDGGSGDSFPVSATSGVVVTRQVEVLSTINAAGIAIIGVMLESLDSAALGHVSFFDADDNLVLASDLARNDPDITDVAGGATNKYGSTPIAYSMASIGSSTQAGTLKIASGEDSTP